MKNGGKNKSVAFIILFSVFIVTHLESIVHDKTKRQILLHMLTSVTNIYENIFFLVYIKCLSKCVTYYLKTLEH